MWFRKHVSDENREWLFELLRQYRKEVRMTQEERRELEKWVASGRSPYENGNYICGEDGVLLDFVSALRAEEEESNYIRSLTPEELTEYLHPAPQIQSDAPLSVMEAFIDYEDELPFGTPTNRGVL